MKNRREIHRLNRTALAVMLGAALSQGVAYAQSTTGSIHGSAPVGKDVSVLVQNSSGLSRVVPVDASGHYSIGALPVGTYTVTLRRDGQVIDSRSDVTLRVNSGTDVSFVTNTKTLQTVTVTGSTIPPIDVTSTDSRTIVTAKELKVLPLGRSAEDIALLAPGVVSGTTAYFSGNNPTGNPVLSFGGSDVASNAYYVNGLNTTDPVANFGGIVLPYGAIDQQEILLGGYGAAYGRSDGGVINQVGKRGTNEWHFGANAEWTPRTTQETSYDLYYPRGPGRPTDGTVYQRRSQSNSWTTDYSVYGGGPLIKDRLYAFAAFEAERTQGNNVGAVTAPQNSKFEARRPKAYVKVDWNINDSNLLELTGVSYKNQNQSDNYAYDYVTGSTGAFQSHSQTSKVSALDWVAKYTSYVTDDLTLSAMFGRQRINYSLITPGGSDDIFIGGVNNQNVAVTPNGVQVPSPQPSTQADTTDKVSGTKNLRLEVNWHVGDHDLTAGIDNQSTFDDNDTTSQPGGYEWVYGLDTSGGYLVGSPSSAQWVAPVPSGANGYYVSKFIYRTGGSVRVKQDAQYIQDRWQITRNLLLSLGLRNDQFTNYNSAGGAYLRMTKPQWAPRLGFSWDVRGDASMRLFGNAGRYYLAVPASVGIRSASGSLYTNQYFTYTSIDAKGVPQGLTPIASSTGGPVSPVGEWGTPPDPATVAPANLKAEYQDEYILGFTSKLADTGWIYGVKGTYRTLRNAMQDICELDVIDAYGAAQLGHPVDVAAQGYICPILNPNRTNVYRVKNANGGYDEVSVPYSAFRMPNLTRTWRAVELSLERPFDGKWYAKIDYVWSKSKGSIEGTVDSNYGQTGALVAWDFPEFEENAYGYQPNDRRHQLKAYGAYQLNKEWLFGANLQVISGTPRTCLGYYGPGENDPWGYGTGYYHWCGGKPSATGSAGRNPWQTILSLNATYRPDFADNKLAFTVMVYNIFDQQKATQVSPFYGKTGARNATYGLPLSSTAPRYLRFGVGYDF